MSAGSAAQDANNGSQVLEDVVTFITRFLSITKAQAIIVALWIAHTHCMETSYVTPYLAIQSAEKQCGKTRLLEVLDLLVSRPWFTGRVSAAVLVRKVDEQAPTLLLDESDAAFNGDKDYSEALRGILNFGHRRGGVASLCVVKGSKVEFRDFTVFCPKAIAGIGRLPDTVADRSIPIRLQRKKPGESVQRFRRRLIEGEATGLRDRLVAWLKPNHSALREACPDLPEQLSDRQQDGAEPLLAIADLAGGDWPTLARHALIELFSGSAAEDQSIGVQLLSDIRGIFEEKSVDRLSSMDLVDGLNLLESRPWPEFNKGRPLTPARLARLLKRFEIAPRSVRDGSATFKGYLRECFEDSWGRYVHAVPRPTAQLARTPSQPTTDTAKTSAEHPAQIDLVTAPEPAGLAFPERIVTGVTAPQVTPPAGEGEADTYLEEVL